MTFASATPPADLQARLDAFAQNKPGGIAAAWVEASGSVFFSAGKISAADARPITADTQFEIGSLTKLFTALLLAESERAGQIALDDPAAKYLLSAGDPLAAKMPAITLRALATHTSGLPRLPSDRSLFQVIVNRADPYAKLTRANLIDSLRTDGPRAAPNAAFAYSNFGFAVLGEALAAAWSMSYAEALRRHVLAPLGLDHTTLALAGGAAPAGFAPPHKGPTPIPRWTFDAYAPGGALTSSVRDLAKFIAAAIGAGGTGAGINASAGEKSAPLAAAFFAAMKPQRAIASGEIGLAWLQTAAAKPPVLTWHNGSTFGSHSFLGLDRARGAGIVLLTNHATDEVDPLGVALLRASPR